MRTLEDARMRADGNAEEMLTSAKVLHTEMKERKVGSKLLHTWVPSESWICAGAGEMPIAKFLDDVEKVTQITIGEKKAPFLMWTERARTTQPRKKCPLGRCKSRCRDSGGASF